MPTSTTGTPAWTTSSTLDEIASWLRGGRQIVVLTHQKPDGDAVGSTLGAVRALNAAAQMTVAQAWYTGPVPAWLPWLAGTTPFRVLNQENGQAVPPRSNPTACSSPTRARGRSSICCANGSGPCARTRR